MTSNEDEEDEVLFEGMEKVVKISGESSIAVNREKKGAKMNGVAHGRSPHQSSSEDDDDDEEEEEEESESDEPLRMPKYKNKKEKPVPTARDELFSRIQFQRRDDPQALLTHETLCNLRQTIETLDEVRDPGHPSTSLHGVVLPDPLHAIQAIDHNLWVLASAASLRLNEVAERCLQLESDVKKEGEEEEKEKRPSLSDVLPKALAALSGQQIGFKEKEPEKPKGKGRAVAAPAAAKPVTRERPVREKAEPKKKPPPQPKEGAKTKSAQTRSNTAIAEKVETPVVSDSKNGKGPKTRAGGKDEEATATANTRKRKAAKDDNEEKKETKAPAKPKGGNTTAKRTSQRTVKKSKEDEPTYCHCNRISFGEMVGCDNETCAIEWFHFECINIKSKPKGKWYCPDCRAEPNNSKLPKKPSK